MGREREPEWRDRGSWVREWGERVGQEWGRERELGERLGQESGLREWGVTEIQRVW